MSDLFETTITGAAVAEYLTSPTYTTVATNAPNLNSKSVIVSAAGGTQTNVDINSNSLPFRMTWSWPSVVKQLAGTYATAVGAISGSPTNKYTLSLQKGVKVNAVSGKANIRLEFTASIPAGADAYDAEDIAAAYSCFVGTLSEGASDIVAQMISGITAGV